MEGFFSSTELAVVKSPHPLVAKCGTCGLFKNCLSPKMPPSGQGKQRILIIGEAPGKTESEQNRQFVGDAGQTLRRALRKHDVNPDEDCWFTNSLICRPPNNRTPTKLEVDYCRPNLIKTINELKPEVIIPLGGTAVESLIPYIWKDDVDTTTRWVGWQIPCQFLNAWVCPSYHPSYLNRMNDPVLDMNFDAHIGAAVALPGRPWPEGPLALEKSVEVMLDVKEAAEAIRSIINIGELVSFDYETNMLKPDSPDARIVCCSICSRLGGTIAYPWHGAAIDATSELLRSDIPKRAYNAKFEERWTQAILGHGVNNWETDGMLLAHVLDNRSGITGLKFQAFVRLGQPPYDEHIKPYLEGVGGNGKNRIHECNLPDLLLYCGMDSILEYHVVAKMKKELQRGLR